MNYTLSLSTFKAPRPFFFPESSLAIAKHATEIHLQPGLLSAHLTNWLTSKNNSEAEFSIRITKGVRLIVNLIPLTKGLLLAGIVKNPDGTFDGNHGGVISDQVCKSGGTAFISVDLNTMGTERKTGKFIIEIIRLPSYMQSSTYLLNFPKSKTSSTGNLN